MSSALETRVVDLLAGGPQSAREIASVLGIQHNSVWNILKPLRLAGRIRILYVKNRGKGWGSGRGYAVYQLVEGT